jgi:transposase-like protein
LERAFEEQRRRTKTIPRFFDERSCLKLVFATLWDASQRWQKVKMSELECKQLDHLRYQLKLDEVAQTTVVEQRDPTVAVA